MTSQKTSSSHDYDSLINSEVNNLWYNMKSKQAFLERKSRRDPKER
jgi:hypothetical protein